MKKVLSLITIVGAIFAPLSAQADPFTGYYKISIVEDSTFTDTESNVYKYADGLPGRGRVFVNNNGKLRFSGWFTEYYFDGSNDVKERVSIIGVVNPTTGKIRLTKIGGELVSDLAVSENFVLNVRIIKRNDVVVGMTGSGSASGSDIDGDFSEILDVTGYKTRDLPE